MLSELECSDSFEDDSVSLSELLDSDSLSVSVPVSLAEWDSVQELLASLA
jgi:hypothetical protein